MTSDRIDPFFVEDEADDSIHLMYKERYDRLEDRREAAREAEELATMLIARRAAMDKDANRESNHGRDVLWMVSVKVRETNNEYR